MKKKKIFIQVSLHEIAADIATGIQSGKIDLSKDTLRGIAEKIGQKGCSPQKIKNHLQRLVMLGFLSIINGDIIYEAPQQETVNTDAFKAMQERMKSE